MHRCKLPMLYYRYGADVRRAEATWGSWFTLDELRAAMQQHRPALLCLVNGETSTGVLQVMEPAYER